MFYRAGMDKPKFDSLNVVEPEFIKNMQEVIGAHSLDDWKTYLRWHTVHDNARILPAAFVNENFDFFAKTMQGTKELRPRWKRCVSYTNGDLGELVGQIYVQPTFGAEGKERTLAGRRARKIVRRRHQRSSMDGRGHKGPSHGEIAGHHQPYRLSR
jgi:endothelin-converting enzyme/putative endopeptidase